MNAESFSQGDSPLHRLDPRVKIILAALFSALVAPLHRIETLFFSLGAAALLIVVSGLGSVRLARRMAVANGMSALAWLVLPFTVVGEPLAPWGFLSPSREGALLALQLTIKLNVLVLALIALIATSGITEIGHALYALRIPEKWVLLLLLTYRYLSVLEQEYQRLSRAAKIRCFRPKTDRHTYRTYGYFIGMLLVRTAIRGERVRRAMLCRCFQGRFYCLRDFRTTRLDCLAAGIGIVLFVWIGVLEWLTVA